MPNVCGNNLDTLIVTFEAKIVKGETTRAELKEMGFPLTPKQAKNVRVVEGAEALMLVRPGQQYFERSGTKGALQDLTEENNLLLLIVPYRNVETKATRLYLNRKKTETKGPDYVFHILFKGDTVYYMALNGVVYDQLQVKWSLLGGVIEILGELGGAVGSIGRAIP